MHILLISFGPVARTLPGTVLPAEPSLPQDVVGSMDRAHSETLRDHIANLLGIAEDFEEQVKQSRDELTRLRSDADATYTEMLKRIEVDERALTERRSSVLAAIERKKQKAKRSLEQLGENVTIAEFQAHDLVTVESSITFSAPDRRGGDTDGGGTVDEM